MSEAVTLSAGAAVLRLSPQGAEAQSWQVDGRELLWGGAPPWPRHAPVLFPIVGRARGGAIRVAGRSYPIGTHGFAAAETLAVTARGTDHASFTLTDSAATRAQYPFRFRLDLSYRLTASAVAVELSVHNPGEVALPFALGLHPGFRWPFAAPDRDGHSIVLERGEVPAVPVIDADGLFTTDLRPLTFTGRRLPLDTAPLTEEALCFLGARSRRLRFEAPSGAAIVIEAENFPHFALWSRPPAPFLCIECWTGHGDPAGFEGELADKPSMRLLAPGGRSRHALRWLFEAAAA